MLEARLEKDEKRVADLIDEIETSHGIQNDRVAWALQKLQAADRPVQIVNMLEARIKRGEQLEPVMDSSWQKRIRTWEETQTHSGPRHIQSITPHNRLLARTIHVLARVKGQDSSASSDSIP